MRFVQLKDLFEIKCKICKSTNIDLHISQCDQCGDTISAECNKCNNKYDYHEFKQIKD